MHKNHKHSSYLSKGLTLVKKGRARAYAKQPLNFFPSHPFRCACVKCIYGHREIKQRDFLSVRAWEWGTKTILFLFNDAYANRTRGWRFVTFYAQTLKCAGWNAFCAFACCRPRVGNRLSHASCAFSNRMLHAAAVAHNTLGSSHAGWLWWCELSD